MYRMNERGIRSVFQQLKKHLPQEQAREMHLAMERKGLAEWFKSEWLRDTVERMEDSADEHGAPYGHVEIVWWTPRKGVAHVYADEADFDEAAAEVE